MKQLLLFPLLLLSLLQTAHGWHLVGGEFSYEYVGGNTYKIVLKLYRDCNSTTFFDDPVSIFVYQGDSLFLKASVHSPSTAVIPADSELCTFGIYCLESAVYDTTINLPAAAGGYVLVYQRCCRNLSLSNIENPEITGMTTTCSINDLSLENGNSSPQFKYYPTSNICVNQLYQFDHSAIDAEDDSLVYHLCTPLQGADPINIIPDPAPPPPYQEVIYSSSYSSSQPLGSSSPITLDSATGMLDVTPSAIGIFLVGVCVEEYRNGSYLGSHAREFEFIVGDYHVGINSIDDEAEIRVFPDPATSQFTIIASSPEIQSATCYDQYGRKIFQSNFFSKSIEVTTDLWYPGIYFIQLRNRDGKIVSTAPVVIE